MRGSMLRGAVLALLVVGAGPALALEGRFVLVEQTYERGERNLAPLDAPVRLEIASSPDGLRARVWAGEDAAASLPWPAILVEGGALPVEIASVVRTPTGGIEARYRTRPAAGEDVVLEIREAYEPSPDGNALLGTVEIRFTGGEGDRGGYTLHRRFERER